MVAFAPDVIRVRKQRPLLRKSAFTTQCARWPRPQVPISQMTQQRYSLMTGDIGAALFAQACIDVDARFPILDVV